MPENRIVYEAGNYWVARAQAGKGFEVFRNSGTHSVKCATIGYEGQAGLARAIAEADRRAALDR